LPVEFGFAPTPKDWKGSSVSQEKWTAVDTYLNQMLLPSDPVLDAALEASSAAGLPAYAVSPSQGKLLFLLARMQGARRILELGTLGGYSTIWLARALPPAGKLVTLEASPRHAEVARTNIANAGLAGLVEFRVGPALDTLPQLAAEGLGPFDLIFIDADKENNPGYFTWALKLSRKGSVMIVDNVVRDGAVVDPSSNDPDIRGIRRLNELLAAEPRVTATAIQTVGSKGYDGFTMVLVTAG
jgi:predicted O-methyltransferase YrrM